jgi:hypothetical protein
MTLRNGSAGVERDMEQSQRTTMDPLTQLKGRPNTLAEKYVVRLQFYFTPDNL